MQLAILHFAQVTLTLNVCLYRGSVSGGLAKWSFMTLSSTAELLVALQQLAVVI